MIIPSLGRLSRQSGTNESLSPTAFHHRGYATQWKWMEVEQLWCADLLLWEEEPLCCYRLWLLCAFFSSHRKDREESPLTKLIFPPPVWPPGHDSELGHTVLAWDLPSSIMVPCVSFPWRCNHDEHAERCLSPEQRLSCSSLSSQVHLPHSLYFLSLHKLSNVKRL